MLAPKVNKKKNTINFIVLLAIMLVILVVIYQNFFVNKKNDGNDGTSVLPGVVNTAIKPVEKIKKEKFELEVLDDERFLNLVEFKYESKPLDELKIGKEDPFKVDELLEVANNKER